jgi:hypothetical protein
MTETTILLDEHALNTALQIRARRSRRNPEYQMEYPEHNYESNNDGSSGFLLDEVALNRALRSKAERRRSRSGSRGQPRNSNYRTLPRRKSSRRDKTSNKKKGSSRESLQKARSFKSESSHNSSTYTGSMHPTVTTRSVNSNNDSLDAVSNHSSMASSREGRKPAPSNQPSTTRSKSEPRRRAKTVPFFHVSTSAQQRAPSPVPLSSSASSSSGAGVETQPEREKRTFFKRTIAPTSIIRPVKDIVDPNADALIEAMGGSEVVESISTRFYVIAKTTSELGPWMDGIHLHQMQEEFVTLGNMEMTDDMVQLSEMVEFHYRLIESGVGVDRVVALWTDAYEAIWLSSDTDDSRSLAGPSRAVFNLKAIANLYDQHQRELRWNRRMEEDELRINLHDQQHQREPGQNRRTEEEEKRIEAHHEQRRMRRQMQREKRRRRRSKSIDSFFSNFRRS